MTDAVLTIENLRHSAAMSALTLTIESKNPPTAGLILAFRNKFPKVASYLEAVVADYKAYDKTEYDFNRLERTMDDGLVSVSQTNFVAISDVMVTVPQGFTGRYIPYLEMLESSGNELISKANRQLEDYYVTLARYASSPDMRQQNKDHTRAFSELERDMEDVKKKLAAFFKNTTHTVSTAGDVFDRATDVKEAVALAKKVNRSRQSIDTSSTLEIAQKIADVLSMLTENAQSGNIPDMTPAVLNNIVEGAMVSARYVEFVAMLRFRMEESVSALTQAVTKLKSASK